MKWRWKHNQVLPQLISIALIIFFSVLLVNVIDLDTLKENTILLFGEKDIHGIPLFMAFNALLYILLIPSTVLGAASGVIFGLRDGIVIYSISCFAASIFIFFLFRFLLKNKIQQLVQKRAKLVEVQSVIEKEGIRFLFLIRFLPVHATFINSLLAVSLIKPSNFLISCLFLIPEWLLHVYIGYVTSVTTQNVLQQGLSVEDYFRIISLVISIVAIVYLGWIAQKVFRQSKANSDKEKIAIANSAK